MMPAPTPGDDQKTDDADKTGDNSKNDAEKPADKTQEDKSVSVTVKAVETEEEGTLEVKLTKKKQNALVQKAIKENAKEVVIETGAISDDLKATTETVKVTVRADLVETLQEADIALTIDTPNGKIQLDTQALQAIADQLDGQKAISFNVKKEATKDYRKIVGTKAYVMSIELYAGEDKIGDFGDGTVQMRVEIPKSLVNSKLQVVYIADDGTVQKCKGKVVTEKTTDKNGKEVVTKYYNFETNHFSVYALAKKTTVNAYIKQQKAINALKKTGVKLTTEVVEATENTDATVQFTWKKTKANKVDTYQVYRATSKKGKYTKVYTTDDASVTTYAPGEDSTTLGTTYYYKVRGVKTIGGKKYYTKWSNILIVK